MLWFTITFARRSSDVCAYTAEITAEDFDAAFVMAYTMENHLYRWCKISEGKS